MRKSLEVVALAALTIQIWMTWQALHGAARLPGRIPTHFDFAGNPNGWGSPPTLLIYPLVAAILYALITATAMFPAAFNYPAQVQVTAENLARLQAIALDMIAWLKAELVCLFAWIQWAAIRAAHNPQRGLPGYMAPIAIVLILGTIGWFLMAQIRAGRPSPWR